MTILKRFREDWANSPEKRILILSIAMITVITFFQRFFTIAINTTDSLPQSIFLISKENKAIARGQYYVFAYSGKATYYPSGTKFVKKLVGLPGERLQTDIEHKTIILNGEEGQKEFKLREKDSKGKKVTDFFYFNGAIPPHKYFFVGESENSYDSRYWGFVDAQNIIGRAYPVF